MRICDGCGKELKDYKYVTVIGYDTEIFLCSYDCLDSCLKRGWLKKAFERVG